MNVAPDIGDSRTKTPEYLLTNILDPNRAIDANFFSYTIITIDGVVHTGVISSDSGSAITLKQPEGKTITVLKEEIEEMKSNGVSLMPVGLEKTINPQQMADLISFIKKLALSGRAGPQRNCQTSVVFLSYKINMASP